ncbi:hypothetical protein [Ottowia sp. VDI28]|uniref:hypothetical protein n=1 Tax=Ottowia sp. VDI28 TaxID=3133968 RepID=UPI003C2B6036
MMRTASELCAELGLSSIALADIPRVVAALHRAYTAGQRDGERVEREACAGICDHYAHALDNGGSAYLRSHECMQAARSIRARSPK